MGIGKGFCEPKWQLNYGAFFYLDDNQNTQTRKSVQWILVAHHNKVEVSMVHSD